MKVYGSGASVDENLNGHAPEPDPDDPDQDDDGWAGDDDQYDFSDLFGAPNYASFIKLAPNAKAKTYERRVASLMKAGMVGSMNAKNYPDAATFLKHGPGFARAAGNLAAEDERVAGIVEMLTAPSSPYVMFALVAVPLVSQLIRNHQSELRETASTLKEKRKQRKEEKKAGIKQPSVVKPITFKLFRRQITVPIKIRFKLPNLKNMFGAFLAPTQHPGEIALEVFSDPAVVKALNAMGLFPQGDGDGRPPA